MDPKYLLGVNSLDPKFLRRLKILKRVAEIGLNRPLFDLVVIDILKFLKATIWYAALYCIVLKRLYYLISYNVCCVIVLYCIMFTKQCLVSQHIVLYYFCIMKNHDLG